MLTRPEITRLSKLEAIARLVCGLDYPSHFKSWESLVTQYKRLLVIASRDHGKTTFFSKQFPIHELSLKPSFEALIMSYSEDQVIKIVSGIKDLIESKNGLDTLKPTNDDDWSKTALHLRNGSTLNSLTFGSSGRGGHYDLVIVDDPVKDYGGMDPDEQEDYFTRAITPMVKPDGQLIVVGNYVYEGDLIERVEKNPAYKVAVYPAINVKGEALWPERWPIKKLDQRRLEIGEYAFAKEYLLHKISLGTQFFKRNMFKFYDPNVIPSRLFRLLSVDPAISLDGDYTAITVTGTSAENKTYLLDYANLRTDDIQLIVDEIFRLVQLHSVPYIQIETIGFQKLLKHWLYESMRGKNYHFGIEEIRTHQKSKEARIMALQPRIAAGSLLFHPTAQEEVLGQFLAFPRGLHDDLADSLSFQVGKWDQPGPIIEPVPYNSFKWWQDKLRPPTASWQEAIGL